MQRNRNQAGIACDRCHGQIKIENAVVFKDKNFHPECFVCDGGCGKLLAGVGGGFFEQPDGIFCKDCFTTKKAPKCTRCNKAVIEKVIKFDGTAWHPDCFACSGCSKSLEGQEITTVDGAPMCKDCYVNRFSDKCHNCNKNIEPGQAFMELEEGKLHATCFKCAACGKSLSGQPCIKNGSSYLCSMCNRNKWLHSLEIPKRRRRHSL